MTIIWATRGRSWGFKFLRDGGLRDPLPTYDLAFAGTEGDQAVCQRVGTHVALRFPDPLERQDQSGRIIPHDIVLLPPMADDVHSVEDGRRLVWPLLADAFAVVWDQQQPPARASLEALLDRGSPSPDTDAQRGSETGALPTG